MFRSIFILPVFIWALCACTPTQFASSSDNSELLGKSVFPPTTQGGNATGQIGQPRSGNDNGDGSGQVGQPGSGSPGGNGSGQIGQPGSGFPGIGSFPQPGSGGTNSAGGSIPQPGQPGSGLPGIGSFPQPGSGGTNPAGGSLPQPGNDTGGPAGGSVTSTCTGSNAADLNAFTAAVKSANSPTSSIFFLGGCSVSMGNFVATPYSATGAQSVSQDQRVIGAAIGAGCSGLADVVFAEFGDYGYVQSGTVKTDICMPGSASPCSPSAKGYMFEIQWNASSAREVQQIVLANGTTVTNADLTCGSSIMGVQVVSPLVIENQPGTGIVTLNPLSTKTYFDLTGTGDLDRISCVQNGSFLALPNENGEVVNIDQLFGNNTVGPDGMKSANGFIALGKYDSNGDGVIDDQDPVFTHLRLWHDINCDGIAEPGEIAPLADLDIKAIRYAHSVAMYEVDPWGNITKQRNIIERIGGGFSRIFDLWFLPAK